MTIQNFALLIFACDRYELLFKGFDFFFKKHWDHSIPIKKYFSTEMKDIQIDGYIHLKSGQGEWTNRLKRVLDQIPEDHIIFMQEDMWYNKRIPQGVLAPLLSHIERNDLRLVKLHSSEVYNTEALDINFNGFTLSRIDKKTSKFLMSHQVSIWNKRFLYAQLKNNEHPWRNERRGSKRLKNDPAEIFHIDLLSENGKPPINKNHPDIKPGAYHTVSMNACLQPNATPFISVLKKNFPDYANTLAHHMENSITHDGKHKPRKEDFFKKLKDKWQNLSMARKS